MKNCILIDSHCHVQDKRFDADREAVIHASLDAGIGMIIIGNALATSRQAVELAEKYDAVWASIGLHPNDDLQEVFDMSAYRELAKHPKVVAIGETGLDYYRTPDTAEQKIQHERFLRHIDLAREFQKPLIIHSRNSYDDTLKVLAELSDAERRGVIHSFTGSHEEASKFIELGFFIGLNGIITFADSYRELVEKLSLDRILCETDAPYLAPVPYRGQRNEPAYVRVVADHIATIKNIPVEEVMKHSVANTKDLFNLSDISD
jgi:TatD DNase family protein